MTEVVSVKFKDTGKAYFFSPAGKTVKIGDKVIVETQNGNELGIVAAANHNVADEDIVPPLKKMLRIATEKDLKRVEENKVKAAEALKICEELVIKHELDMKLVEVEYSFDGGKIVFSFTSDGRVDFRELVKDLAARFHTRIELRQIGVRDEAQILGGIGICGQPYCCKRFLGSFDSVSIKMAKSQGLSLNPTKISGSCGRLMCCLKFEEDAYSHLASITPHVGSTVKTPDGLGTVTDVNLVSGNLYVKLHDSEAMPIKIHRDKVERVHTPKKPQKPQNEQ